MDDNFVYYLLAAAMIFVLPVVSGIYLGLQPKTKKRAELTGFLRILLDVTMLCGVSVTLVSGLVGSVLPVPGNGVLFFLGLIASVAPWIIKKSLQEKKEQELIKEHNKKVADAKAKEEAERQARMEAYHEEIQREVEAERLAREQFKRKLSSIPRYEISVDPSAEKQNINVSDFYVDYSSLRKNMNLSRVSSFVAIDTETTGLTPGRHKIVQVSAVRFEGYAPTEIFTTYINPGCPIPPEATDIHGITDDIVADAPKFENILDSLEEFIGASTIVGHNLQFDLKFLRKFGYDSLKSNRSYFDTLTLSRTYDEIDSHKLIYACQEHGIYYTAHNSSEDALATGLLFVEYLKIKVSDLF